MEQLKEAAPERPPADPLLQRMLATHIHCGEAMQLITADLTPPVESPEGKNDGVLLTYRCTCGFRFDHARPSGTE